MSPPENTLRMELSLLHAHPQHRQEPWCTWAENVVPQLTPWCTDCFWEIAVATTAKAGVGVKALILRMAPLHDEIKNKIKERYKKTVKGEVFRDMGASGLYLLRQPDPGRKIPHCFSLFLIL